MKTHSEIRLALARACTLAVAAGALSAQAAITDGLVGHWTFNETSGATAKDTSGKGHDGAVSNQWGEDPAWTTGQMGGALSFRGPDSGGDAVIVTGLPAFTETFSVSAWVLADPRDGTWPESSIVDSSGLTVDGPLGLVVRLKNRDQAFGPLGNTTVDAGGSVVLNETVGFPVSVWQQVGLVADGTRIHLYRNGVEVGTANYVPPLPDPISPELGIGVTPDDGGFPGGAFWQGKIDDVGIWTTPLTASQMASIFNAGQAGKDLTQADAYQNLPPTITTQPISITRFVGETATFSVQAAGTSDLAYQWKLSGNNIAGATASTYTIASVKESDAGQYTVVVTNAGGSTESQQAALQVQTVSIATGLVGYWKFDEKQGETAADATSNANNGSLVNYMGDNSQWVEGQIGGALSFGGSEFQQFLLIPDYPKPTSTLTVSAWVWAESLGSWSSFVKNWGSSDAGQFHFGIFSDATHQNIYIKQADGKTPNVSDPDPFPLGSWQQVAFVCDGSNVRLYRNGAEVASTTYDGTLVSPPMSCIGVGVKIANDCLQADTGAAGWFQGRMDDVAIWNRGLNAAEMVAIYKAGLDGNGVLEADVNQKFPPTFASQSTNVTVFEDVNISLNAAANGTPPLTYQWFKAGVAIAGATSGTLNLGPARMSMAGVYHVVVTNEAGSATSADITVAVQARPLATLVSEWKFEQNLEDTAGNNDGTAAGAVEYIDGIVGKAVRIAAASPIANDAAQGLPILGSDSWSLNLWLRLATPPKSLAYLAGFGPVSDAGAGTPRALIAFTGPQNNNIYAWGSNRDTGTDEPYPINRWAMVTITHDGADGTTSILLDGAVIGQNMQPRVDIPEFESRISIAPTSAWTVDVGGDFDEFTIWKGVLAPSQIQSLYSVGGPPSLQASVSGSALTISWPSTAAGFTLETADRLVGGTWTAVPNVTGTSVTVAIGSGNAFFRLRQ